jgi:hypothetical protein
MKSDYIPIASGHIYSKKTNRILKPASNGNGYQHVVLRIHNKNVDTYVHRFIAEALLPNPHNHKEVNHIDGNKSNNDVTNLEWVSSSENKKHAVKTGLRKTNFVSQYTLDNQFICRYTDANTAEYFSNVRAVNIRRCCNGYRKSAGGFLWEYS